MTEKEIMTHCPHCGASLDSWKPYDAATWGDTIQKVCFNDECPYFKEGWDWMKSQFNQNTSYRFRFNPESGEKGPLPVWSADALKNQVVK